MNEVEPLSTEASEFLNTHRETGTPTAQALRRVRERVAGARVVPLRRGWRMPEVWAVAAVVLLSVAGHFIYLAVKGPNVEARLNEAWAKGSREQLAAAVESCRDDACRARANTMLAAMKLAERMSSLNTDELHQLEALDAELSREGVSPLTSRMTERRLALGNESVAAKQLERALSLERGGSRDEAIAELKRCVKQTPAAHRCWLALGELLSQSKLAGSNLAYENFLAVAPANDPERPRVTALLDHPQGSAVDANDVKMMKGAKAMLRVKAGLARIAVGDPAIVEIATSGDDTIELTGKSAGITTMLVWFSDGTRQTMTITVE